jgi:MYXO-CTERM domain-containing protein
MVTSTQSANVIDERSNSVYGFPALRTCDGSLVMQPGKYYEFYYDAANGHTVTQVNCSTQSASGAGSGLISVLPGSLAFGSEATGTTSAAQTVTVKNPTSNDIALSITLSEEFGQSNTCGGTLPAGASCTMSVTFTPANTGVRSGILNITDVTDGYSQTVALTGSGTQASNASPNIALASSTPSLQVPASGQAATSYLYITAQNGFQGTVYLQCQVVLQGGGTAVSAPVCSLSVSQVQISGANAALSKLSVILQPPSGIAAESKAVQSRTMALAGLVALGLLPLARRRKSMCCTLLCLPLVFGMASCGFVPANSATTATSYKVLVSAVSGPRSTSIAIPLQVQQ